MISYNSLNIPVCFKYFMEKMLGKNGCSALFRCRYVSTSKHRVVKGCIE